MKFLAAVFSLFWAFLSWGTTYYSQSSSTPSTTSNWNSDRLGAGSAPSGFSSSSDVFVIQNGHTMTTSASWALSGSNMTLQIENGGILQADHIVDLTPSSTFQVDNGGIYKHNFDSDEIFDGTESFGATSTVELQARPAGSFSVLSFGHLVVNISTASGSLRFNAGNTGTIDIDGDLTIQNTGGSSNELRCATGSATGVTLDVAGDFNLTGGRFNFYSASGGTNGTINVGGNFLLTGGTFDNDGSNNLTINLNADEASSTFNTSGVTAAGSVYADVDWNIASGNTITLLSNWEIGAGEVLTVNGQLNFSTFFTDGSGSITVPSSGTLGIGASDGIDNTSTAGNIHFTLANRNIDAGCTIVYNGAAAQETGDGLDDIGTLTGTLQISNTSAKVIMTDGTDLTFGDGFTLTVDEGTIFEIGSGENIVKGSGSSASANINGTLNVESSSGFSAAATGGDESLQGFTSCSFGANSVVDYSRSSAQSISNQFTYGALTLSNAGTKTASGALDINGNFSVSGSVTFVAGSLQHNIAGGWSVGSSASFTESGSTIVFDGTGTHTILNAGGTETFDDIQFTGSGTYNLSGAVRLNSGHTLTISDGTVNTGDNELDGPSANLTMSGGTLNLESVTSTDQLPDFGGTISLSSGTVELGGAGNQILNGGETYNNLTFSGSGEKTLSSTTANISTITISESCTLNVENRTLGGASTNLTMDGGHYVTTGSGTKPVSAGTYNLTGGTIEFAGNSSQTIRSPKTYFNILVSGTDVSSSTGDYTLANGGSFVVNSGAIFTTSSRQITTSGTASVTINGTFITSDADGFSGGAGTSIASAISSITLGSSSTIEYAASSGTQNITERSDYANLIFSGSSTKSMSGAPETSGNFSVSGGAVTLPTTITFDGSAAQNIPSLDYSTTNIVLSGGGDKSLLGATTFNGTVTFTSGNLDLGNNDLTLGSSAVVSSANSSSYIKINGTGRLKQTISSGSNYSFPVGQNPYLPVTVSCASCSSKEISIGVEDVLYEDPTTKTTTLSAAGHSNYVDKTWDLTSSSTIAGNVTIELQWNNSDQTSDPGSNNSSNNMSIGYWENGVSSAWNNAAVSAASVSGSVYSISRTISGLSTNKYFLGVGSNTTPLPVTYSRLESTCLHNLPVLEWETSLEENCSHFVVQTSRDGVRFENAQRVEGHGNSYSPISYSAPIEDELSQFARLVQVDFNGESHHSKVIGVGCTVPNQTQFMSSHQGLTFKQDGLPYTLYTVSGTLIAQGVTTSELNVLPAKTGIYILHLEGEKHRVFIP